MFIHTLVSISRMPSSRNIATTHIQRNMKKRQTQELEALAVAVRDSSVRCEE